MSTIRSIVESFAINLAFALVGVLILKLFCYVSKLPIIGGIA